MGAQRARKVSLAAPGRRGDVTWREVRSSATPRFDAWSYRLLVRACYAEGRRTRQWAPNLLVLPVDGRLAHRRRTS